MAGFGGRVVEAEKCLVCKTGPETLGGPIISQRAIISLHAG